MNVRGAWAHEHGLVPNSAADQAALVRAFISDVVGKGGGTGQDLGHGMFPPGTFRVASTVAIDEIIGVTVRGAGVTEAISGPRNHGGWTSFLSGTAFAWTGAAAGGPVFSFTKSRDYTIEFIEIYLGLATGENHAALGVHFFPTDGFGQGKMRFHRVNFIAVDQGGTGIQMGDAAQSANDDSGVFDQCNFRNLDTCVHHVSGQNLAHRYINCEMRQCLRFLYIEAGGQVFIENLHVVSSIAQDMVIVECDSGGFYAGHHHINGGYVDRQASGQDVTIFDYDSDTAVLCAGTVRDFSLRSREGGASYDSATPAYFELSHQAQVLAERCNLNDQPVVRFHSTLFDEMQSYARLVACTFSSGTPKLAGEIVQAVGGYCGVVDFEGCRRHIAPNGAGEVLTGSVGRSAGGNEDAHYDCEDFDGSDTGDFASSWLNTTHTVLGYWRMNDAIGATTIDDQKGSADLTVESDVIVPRAPLGLLGPRSANWANQSTGPVDTGISLTPATVSYTFFGWVYIDDASANQVVFSHNPATGNNMRIWQIDTSRNLYNGTAAAQDLVKQIAYRRWVHLITVYHQATDFTSNYLNGTLYTITQTAGIAALAAGNLHVGGDADAALRARVHLSRVGVLQGELNNAEASLLFLKASTQVNKPIYRPT